MWRRRALLYLHLSVVGYTSFRPTYTRRDAAIKPAKPPISDTRTARDQDVTRRRDHLSAESLPYYPIIRLSSEYRGFGISSRRRRPSAINYYFNKFNGHVQLPGRGSSGIWGHATDDDYTSAAAKVFNYRELRLPAR